MVKILYELNGKPVQLNEINNSIEIDGLVGWGNTVSQASNNLVCPKCKTDCYITIILNGGKGLAVRTVDVCHIEYYNLINDSLSPFAKMTHEKIS